MSENKGFTIIQNEIINSGKVSLKAMGLFLYLKSKPKEWRFSTLRIQKDFSDGLFAIRKAMKELEEVGLLERKKQKTKRDNLKSIIFLTKPCPKIRQRKNRSRKLKNLKAVSENPPTGKPTTGKPKSEIQTIKKRMKK